jgi:hypothetical protein
VPYRDFSGDKPIKGDHVFRLHYSQRSLDGLVHMFYSFGINMDPDYQRGLVWTLEDKQALIESIFDDVDIGKFVFAQRPFEANAPGYEIIDGKQRLSALIDFTSAGSGGVARRTTTCTRATAATSTPTPSRTPN